MVGDKIRFRFEKAGDLRLLSHHDLMRCGERMLRRAAVPFRSTAGFHPTPRLVFALSLPLGVAGRNEVVELELTEPLSPADVLARLNAQAPSGLRFTSAAVVPLKTTAVPRRVVYRLPLPADRAADAATACADLMAREKVWADRLRPRPRRVNVRPYLRRLVVEAQPLPQPPPRGGEGARAESPSPPRGGVGEGFLLTLDLWVTQSGTARADELLRLLGVQDVADAGSVVERTELEIHDETPPGAADGPPPEGPPETLPLDTPSDAVSDADEPAAAGATWGLSPNGPVVE